MNIAFPLSKGCRGPWQQSVKVAQKIVKRGWPFIRRIPQDADSSCITSCVVCGGESVGKSELLASLTGSFPVPENFRGSTISCETYNDGNLSWIDTPGILLESDTFATRSAIKRISAAERVILVIRADRASEELHKLLHVVAGKLGFVVLTFSDRLSNKNSNQVKKLSLALKLPVFAVDARNLKDEQSLAIREAALKPTRKSGRFSDTVPDHLPLITLPDRNESIVEQLVSRPFISLLLLFLPAALAIIYTNRIADWLYTPLAQIIEPALTNIATWPSFLSTIVGGSYGLLSMFPFIVLYAVPTILVFSAILAIYKSSGLMDRMSIALHSWLRPVGMGGRDIVRVVMGFGCNVPAIVSSRSCHTCSRGACVSAISFGSACSYQLPATLAVFAAAGMPQMGVIYLVILTITTLIYLRFTTPRVLRLTNNSLLIDSPESLSRPSWGVVRRDIVYNFKSFVIMAFPIFVVICIAASILDQLGVLAMLSRALVPVMAIFNLPGDAATAVILGSIRKDGIAVGLLDNVGGAFNVGLNTPTQILTAVYLAGVLLPCLVTVFTIIREMRWRFALKLCARQMLWAAMFAIAIAWGGPFIF
jgi:Fe2+ transport system protein B